MLALLARGDRRGGGATRPAADRAESDRPGRDGRARAGRGQDGHPRPRGPRSGRRGRFRDDRRESRAGRAGHVRRGRAMAPGDVRRRRAAATPQSADAVLPGVLLCARRATRRRPIAISRRPRRPTTITSSPRARRPSTCFGLPSSETPATPGHVSNWATCWPTSVDWTRRWTQWRQAVERDASLSVALRNLGLYEAAVKNDLPAAAALYRKAIAARPTDQTLSRDLAEILIADGKRPEAIDVLEKMPVEGTRRADVTILLAQAYLDAERYDDTIAVLESTPYFVNWEGQDITWAMFNKAHLARGQRHFEREALRRRSGGLRGRPDVSEESQRRPFRAGEGDAGPILARQGPRSVGPRGRSPAGLESRRR